MSEEKKTVSAGTEKTVKGLEIPTIILTDNCTEIKSQIVAEARKKMTAKEVVQVVRQIYPRYDKQLQSKVEHGELYGIELRADALRLLADPAPRKSRDAHKMSRRISARLPEKMHDRLLATIKGKGFESVQSWLTYIVTDYLRKETAK